MCRSVYRMCRLVCFQSDSLLINKEEKHVSRTYLQSFGKTTAVLGNSVDSASSCRNNGLLIGSAYLYACGCFLILYIMRSLCEKDEQLFHQLYLYWLLNYKSFPNRAYWKSVISFAPNVKEKEIPLLISRADQTFLASKELNQHD